MVVHQEVLEGFERAHEVLLRCGEGPAAGEGFSRGAGFSCGAGLTFGEGPGRNEGFGCGERLIGAEAEEASRAARDGTARQACVERLEREMPRFDAVVAVGHGAGDRMRTRFEARVPVGAGEGVPAVALGVAAGGNGRACRADVHLHDHAPGSREAQCGNGPTRRRPIPTAARGAVARWCAPEE